MNIQKNKVRWIFSIFFFVLSSTAHAELQERAEGKAYYDTNLDITWLANAHLAATESFGVTGIRSSGNMTWYKAMEWIGEMNAANYLGVNKWRLPKVNPLNGANYQYTQTRNGTTDNSTNISAIGTLYEGSTANELAYLYYNTLKHTHGAYDIYGSKLPCAPSGLIVVINSCMNNNGLFSTFNQMAISQFWTEIRIPLDVVWWDAAFSFSFYNGAVSTSWVGYGGFFAWAVVDGDAFNDDSDGDSISDDNDVCQDSDISELVTISDCDTAVLNSLDTTGCTISDKINICRDSNDVHGQYMKCTARLLNDLHDDNMLKAWEKSSVLSCAAKKSK